MSLFPTTRNYTDQTTSLPRKPKDFWDEAQKQLNDDTMSIISKHIAPGSNILIDIEDLLAAATLKQKLCEDKRWTFEFKGRTLRLSDAADKVVTWLDKFKAIGDIAVNADSLHAGLPWAGIRFLLQVRSLRP